MELAYKTDNISVLSNPMSPYVTFEQGNPYTSSGRCCCLPTGCGV